MWMYLLKSGNASEAEEERQPIRVTESANRYSRKLSFFFLCAAVNCAVNEDNETCCTLEMRRGSLKYANARTAMTKRRMTVLLERDGL